MSGAPRQWVGYLRWFQSVAAGKSRQLRHGLWYVVVVVVVVVVVMLRMLLFLGGEGRFRVKE